MVITYNYHIFCGIVKSGQDKKVKKQLEFPFWKNSSVSDQFEGDSIWNHLWKSQSRPISCHPLLSLVQKARQLQMQKNRDSQAGVLMLLSNDVSFCSLCAKATFVGVSGLTMRLILLLPVMMFCKRHAIWNTVAETVRWGALFFWADGNILAAASNGAIDCIRTSATQFAGVPPDSQRLSGEGLWYVLHVEELPMYQCDSICSLSWAKEVQPHLRFWFQWFW